jgi:small subunit ribosomal protein S20
MANIKSQIKRNRQNEKLRLRNKSAKAELRTRVKSALTERAEGAASAAESLRLAIKRLDQAASKGIIHKNQAANRKSRLVKRLSKLN